MHPVQNQKHEPKGDNHLAWFRITVVVASAGYCAGQVLLWLKP